MDLELALMVEQLVSFTNSSSFEENKFYENLEHLNRMSLMIIKRNIPKTFRGVTFEEVTNGKQLLVEN